MSTTCSCRPCDPERHRHLGVEGRHASCAENLREATAELGISVADPPQPVDVFMEVLLDPGGGLALGTSPAGAGDRISLRPEASLVVALSACPQDVVTINAHGPADLVLEVRAAGAP